MKNKNKIDRLSFFGGLLFATLLMLIIFLIAPTKWWFIPIYVSKLKISYYYGTDLQKLVGNITHGCVNEYCDVESIFNYFRKNINYSTTVVMNDPIGVFEVGYADCDTGSYAIGNMLAIKGIRHKYMIDDHHTWLKVYLNDVVLKLDWTNNEFFVIEVR